MVLRDITPRLLRDSRLRDAQQQLLSTKTEFSTGLWDTAQVGTLALGITQAGKQIGFHAHGIQRCDAQTRLQALFAASVFLHAELDVARILAFIVKIDINPVSARSLVGPVFKHSQIGTALMRVVNLQHCRVKVVTGLRAKGDATQHR
ncbi:hypothetical protein D3C75_900230 [compost metagenome]